MTEKVETDPLTVDPAREVERISEFLRRQLARTPRRLGLVVGLSGGKTLGVLLPERESQPESRELARDAAARLGIETVVEELTPALTGLGVYERREAIVRSLFPEFETGWAYRVVLPGDLRQRRELNFHYLEVERPDGVRERRRLRQDAYRELQAGTNVKQRLRMLRLYEHAERRAFLVAGTTNRSEVLQGFFVRYGDGGVDVEPLAHLFKTQVYELARYLEVPPAIIQRPPSPDTYSAAVEVAARRTGLSVEDAGRALQEVARREQASRRLRELPPEIELDMPTEVTA